MSDKPNIYAHCQAGCLWETVHMSDFEKSAAFIQQYPNESGDYILQLGKDYKIFAPKNTDKSFTSSVVLSYLQGGVLKTYTFPKSNIDEYAEAFTFRLLDVNASSSALNIVFEYAGSRYTETISGSNITLLDNDYLKVSGATNVYLYNSDTQLIGVRGKDGVGCYVNGVPTAIDFTSDPQQQIDVLKKLYGVGSIYMSTNSTSPAELFGGTWEQIKDRFLLGAGDSYSAGATGGSATVTLEGKHLPNMLAVGVNNSGENKTVFGAVWGSYSVLAGNFVISNKSILNTIGNSLEYGQSHNNMPPYLAVYIWRRTA